MVNQTDGLIKNDLADIVDAIRLAVDPAKIVLFGSQARGEGTRDSDLDICIITGDDAVRSLDVAFHARLALAHVTMQPIDIVAVNPGTYAKRSQQKGTLEYEIAQEGVVLYG